MRTRHESHYIKLQRRRDEGHGVFSGAKQSVHLFDPQRLAPIQLDARCFALPDMVGLG